MPKGQYDHAVMISNGKQDDKTIAGSLKGAEALSDTASGLSVSITNATAGGADVRIGFGTVPGPTSSASPTKPGAGTTPAPTLSTSTSPTPPAPVQPTREGDVTTDIGATGLPTPSTGTSAGDATATATAAGAAATGPDSLAHTGATTTVTAVVGGLLILVGGTTAVTVARRRRP
ncbi:LPXTG cell wall anchor domain-containing protein [Kitasatospora aburaviensis]